MKLGKFVWISLLAIVSFGVGCGGGGGSGSSGNNNMATLCPRIINGESCNPKGSPIVAIRINSLTEQALCTGTVIAPKKVLTAAHCFAFSTVVSAVIDAGVKTIKVSRIDTHPQLQANSQQTALFNDVAVLTTKSDIGVNPLPLVLSRSVSEGDKIGINGYGKDENGQLGSLKGGEMVVSQVTSNHIFANFDGNGQNTCNGDSGGPATYTFTSGGDTVVGIVGITSTGIIPECSKGDTTLFTNIQASSVLNFILDHAPDVGTI